MYQKNLTGWMKHWDFSLIDVCCLFLAFILAYYVRHDSVHLFSVQIYRNMAIFLILVEVILLVTVEPFKDVLRRGYYVEFVRTLQQACYIMVLSIFYLFCVKNGSAYSRIVLFLTVGFYLILSYLFRILWKKLLHERKRWNRRGRNRMILITTLKQAEEIIDHIESRNYGTYYIDGMVIIDQDMTGYTIRGIPVICRLDQLNEHLLNEWIDEILIADDETGNVSREQMEHLINMGITVHQKLIIDTNPDGYKKTLEKIAGFSCITSSINVMTTRQMVQKRILDIAGALVGCLITLILTIIIGPLIYLQSPGPIFFTQERIGKNGKKFKMYKFRSMYMDAEERKAELLAQNKLDSNLMFKMDDDPRIIGGRHGIGGIIRRYSLDEFPQFYNVLVGDMSLVGTRPPTLDEWEQYEEHHRARMATNPGITGMWQTSGRSDINDFEEVVRMDTEYIENWSVGLDIKLLLKTIMQVVQADGAM